MKRFFTTLFITSAIIVLFNGCTGESTKWITLSGTFILENVQVENQDISGTFKTAYRSDGVFIEEMNDTNSFDTHYLFFDGENVRINSELGCMRCGDINLNQEEATLWRSVYDTLFLSKHTGTFRTAATVPSTKEGAPMELGKSSEYKTESILEMEVIHLERQLGVIIPTEWKRKIGGTRLVPYTSTMESGEHFQVIHFIVDDVSIRKSYTSSISSGSDKSIPEDVFEQ